MRSASSSTSGGGSRGQGDLSGGRWQRLPLARLMYRDAEPWILDEPTSALAPGQRRRSSGS